VSTEADCQNIIAEFDSNQDQTMGYDEFLMAVMPAANQNLRDYCLYGRRVAPYYNDPARPLPVSVTSLAVRIFEREIQLAHKKDDLRNDLFKNVDHQKLKTFNAMSRGRTEISMPDFIAYME